MTVVEALEAAPGNAVVYSRKAWAAARKASHGGVTAQWFPDCGASRLGPLGVHEMARWTDDWEVVYTPPECICYSTRSSRCQAHEE